VAAKNATCKTTTKKLETSSTGDSLCWQLSAINSSHPAATDAPMECVRSAELAHPPVKNGELEKKNQRKAFYVSPKTLHIVTFPKNQTIALQFQTIFLPI